MQRGSWVQSLYGYLIWCLCRLNRLTMNFHSEAVKQYLDDPFCYSMQKGLCVQPLCGYFAWLWFSLNWLMMNSYSEAGKQCPAYPVSNPIHRALYVQPLYGFRYIHCTQPLIIMYKYSPSRFNDIFFPRTGTTGYLCFPTTRTIVTAYYACPCIGTSEPSLLVILGSIFCD